MSLISEADIVVVQNDENANDFDGISGTPMTATLLNAAGVQDKTTFFLNNNISEKNDPYLMNAMSSVEDFVKKLGFETVDYQKDIDKATDKLVDLFNSGKKVLVLEAGPMESTYRALAKTSKNNLDKITLLSHSKWNETRDVITRPGVTQARNWEDIKEDFPEVRRIEIADQNGADNSGDKGFYSHNFNWIENKDGEVYKELSNLVEKSKKDYDFSDAGLTNYAITGNQYGDPADAKSYLEAHPPHFVEKDPTPTPSNNDEYDIRVDYGIDPGWNNNSLNAEISFTNKGDSFQGWKMEFEADYKITEIDNAEIISHQGNKYEIGAVSTNDNVYENEVTTFSFTAEGDFSKTPEDWTFNGQELENWEVDTKIPDNNSTPDPSSNNGNYWKIEAEDMQLSSQYKIENNNYASGDRLISLLGGDSNSDTGYAGFQFGGKEGTYSILIDAYDESDGKARIEMVQGTNFLKGFDLDRNNGSNIADNSSAVTLEIKNVFISEGDYFRLTGIEDGNVQSADHARIDLVEFIPVDTSF